MNTSNKKDSNTAGSSTSKPSAKSKDDAVAVVEPTKKNTPKAKTDKSDGTIVFTSRRVWPD